MYCTCSNKNNYEIISLCDIKKFTDKNGPFNNKGWVQISIADVLMLDCNKLAIEKIEKVYVNVDIVSTKIIETPISPSANSEGMVLTGKKLLIDGYICSKIVYTSLTKEQSVYTSNFTVPFCTYIVIESTADPFNDKYCIKSCIEDVFLSLIDCKTIFQNATLFLLAEKVSFTCPSPQTPSNDCTITNNIIPPQPVPPQPDIPTTFINHIILNSINDTPVIDISFNNLNKEIIVTSTGNTTDPAGVDNYFTFTLYEADGTTEKLYSTIGGNEDGMNFSTQISNQNFQEGDIVKLQAEDPSKVIITNYPDSSTPKYTLTKPQISFKITPNNLEPVPNSKLPNEIIIKKSDGSTFGTIYFDKSNNKFFLVGFKGEYSSSGSDYALINVKLYHANSSLAKDASLKSTSGASNFLFTLNGASYDYGSVLELSYDEKSKSSINITNFPNASSIHTPTVTREYYKITPAGLVAHNPISNVINFKERNTGTLLCTLIFDVISKEVKFTVVNQPTKPQILFAIKSQTPSGVIKVLDYDTSTSLYLYVTPPVFNYSSCIELEASGNNSCEITNYPNPGDSFEIYSKDLQNFDITINGLKKVNVGCS